MKQTELLETSVLRTVPWVFMERPREDRMQLIPVAHLGLPTLQQVVRHDFAVSELRVAATADLEGLNQALRVGDLRRVNANLVRMAQLVDQDRAAQVLELVRDRRLNYVEYLGLMLVPNRGTDVVCPDHSQWRIVPLELEEELVIPAEAKSILEAEARAGLAFDRCLVLHEVHPGPQPVDYAALEASLAQKATQAVGKFLEAAAQGVASALARLGACEPALVGVIQTQVSGNDFGHYFVLVRWI